MDILEAKKRVDLSETVIKGWEEVGMAGSRVEDKMRMIFAETQVLYSIEHGFPPLTERAKAVGARYGKLAMAVKTGR
jgi:hypothetical protein